MDRTMCLFQLLLVYAIISGINCVTTSPRAAENVCEYKMMFEILERKAEETEVSTGLIHQSLRLVQKYLQDIKTVQKNMEDNLSWEITQSSGKVQEHMYTLNKTLKSNHELCFQMIQNVSMLVAASSERLENKITDIIHLQRNQEQTIQNLTREVETVQNLIIGSEDRPVQTPTPSTTGSPRQTEAPTAASPTKEGHTGSEFLLMVTKCRPYFRNYIRTSTTPSTTVRVDITSKYFERTDFLQSNSNSVEINDSLIMKTNGKSDKGILLISDTPTSISVYSHDELWYSDGYTVLPTHRLGSSYVVVSCQFEVRSTSSYFAIGAIHDDTIVTVTVQSTGQPFRVSDKTYSDGDTFTVNLNKLDTYYVESSGDFSGTQIASNKDVAVISGNICSNQDITCYNGNFAEFLPPVSKWGSKVMVPPLVGVRRGSLKVIPYYNNTEVFVESSNNFSRTYNLSGHVTIPTNMSQPYVVSSTEPVLVLLYTSFDLPLMTVIPSVDQFSSETVYLSSGHMYISIIIQSAYRSGLQMLNGNGTVLHLVGDTNFTSVDDDKFSFLSADCALPLPCSVRHVDQNVTFGVIIYGYGPYEAYGFPANLRYTDDH